MPQPAPEHRRHVFISYSRADRAWVDRLRTFMAPWLRQAGEELLLWDDSQIRPGERWQQTIETALAQARVALLLVSAEFLASEFVMGREVPVLLEAAEREGVTILWVSLSPCGVSRTPIHAYQAVLPPDPSLLEMSEPEQRRALLRIAEGVHQALLEATEQERRRERQQEVEATRRREQQEREAQLEREEREALARRRAEELAREERLRVEAERQRDAEQRQREEARLRQAEQERRQREEEQRRRERQRQEQERRAKRQQELEDLRARWRRDRQRALEGLWTRRRLLIAAAGLPLGALGLARLSSRGPASLPLTTGPGGGGGDQALRTAASGSGRQGTPQTITVRRGWLERSRLGWQIQTRPLQVRSRLEQLAPNVTLRLIEIPAGRFLMGSHPNEEGRHASEDPPHEVTLKAFWLGQTPITQAQWREVAGWPKLERELEREPSGFKGDDRPVENVSWHDAREFCGRLSQRLGRAFSLPSEAQWEYACRAGTTTPFAFGETISPELANYDGSVAYANGPTGVNRGQTTPVGNFPANAWGLQDMHGNVWEWCLDQWHDSYEGAPADGSAWLSMGGEDVTRLLRGGSWYRVPHYCRSAYRDRNHPDDRNQYKGFRVCCLPQD